MAKAKQMTVETSTEDKKEETDLKVGQILARARQKRRREVKRIADQLCIRSSYLEALENSQYDVFPGQVYAIGFLKTYATYLGLDADALIEQYKKETDFLTPKPVIMPIPERSSMMPTVSYILAGLFVIALVWGVWYFASYEQVKKEAVLPPIVEAEAEMTPIPVVVEETEPVVETAEAEPVTPVQPVEPLTRIKIVAHQDVWLEIQDEDMFIFNRVLKAGETFDVPDDSENMMLKTGNAGGMDIYVDGEKIKPLGPAGAVRSRIKLSAEALKNR